MHANRVPPWTVKQSTFISWWDHWSSASLDSTIGTGFYKLLLVFAISYTLHLSKFYMPTLINHRNNSRKAPIGLYFVRPTSLLQCYFKRGKLVNIYIITGFPSVPHPNLLRACRSSLCSSAVPCHGPWIVNASLEETGTYLSYPILSYPFRSVGLHLQTWSPEYRIENTLQSDNPTSYFTDAYIFMAKTTFIRWFLASICVVIWIYFVYFSPWRVRIGRKDLVNKGTSFEVIGK